MTPTTASTTATAGPSSAAARGGEAGVDAVVGALTTGVDGVVGVDVDALDDAAVRTVLAGAETAIRRLQAVQARLAQVLSRRRATAARAQSPEDPRAPQKAARAVRGELTDQLGITPSQAKQMTATGAQLEHLPVTAAAFAAGEVTSQHVRVIDEVTAHFHGEARTQFEDELVDLARGCRDAVEFGRQARRRLIERDHDAAMRDLERKKARRSGRVAQSEDGTTHLRLDTAGYEGELVHTVVDAFRIPDAPGQHRTAEQRTHDAIVAAFEVALRADQAPTQHGVRPHVSLVFRADAVRPRRGAAETTWTGPLPYAEVARLLGDCSLSRIVTDAEDVPLSVSTQVRTVPMGLWRLLVHRDGGCIVEGCDAPAGWCQVAHLDDPFRAGGKLSPDTAGLLCTTGPNHHATFDNGDFDVVWTDGRPTVDLRGRTIPPVEHPGGRAYGSGAIASESRAAYRSESRATGRAGPGGGSRHRPIGRNMRSGAPIGADNRDRAPRTRGDPRLRPRRPREPRRCSPTPQDQHGPDASSSRWWWG